RKRFSRPRRRSDDQIHIVSEVLSERHINLNEIFDFIGPALHLTGHADDLSQHLLGPRGGRRPRGYPHSDRRPSLKITTDERLVHDANLSHTAGIALAETPACHDRKIQRLKVRRADDLEVGRRTLILVHRRATNDFERGWACVGGTQRQRARPGHGPYSRKRQHFIVDSVEELLQPFRTWILRT